MSNISKKKKRLVVDEDAIYWEVDGRRLSNEEEKKLQEEISNEYFENSKGDNWLFMSNRLKNRWERINYN